MSRRHELKCWPESFEAIRSGAKRFDVRIDARASAVGYLGKALTARGAHARGAWGLPSSVVVMSLVVEDDAAEDVDAEGAGGLARWR